MKKRLIFHVFIGILTICVGLYLSFRPANPDNPTLERALIITCILFLLTDGISNFFEGRTKR